MKYWNGDDAEQVARAWDHFERHGSKVQQWERLLTPPPPLPKWQLVLSWVVIIGFWVGFGCLAALWLLDGIA